MPFEDLEKAERESIACKLAHEGRNDLLVVHGILLQATKLLVDAQHRLNGTMQSLECLGGKKDESPKSA